MQLERALLLVEVIWYCNKYAIRSDIHYNFGSYPECYIHHSDIYLLTHFMCVQKNCFDYQLCLKTNLLCYFDLIIDSHHQHHYYVLVAGNAWELYPLILNVRANLAVKLCTKCLFDCCIRVTVLLEYFDLFDNVAGPLPGAPYLGPLNKVGPALLLPFVLEHWIHG